MFIGDGVIGVPDLPLDADDERVNLCPRMLRRYHRRERGETWCDRAHPVTLEILRKSLIEIGLPYRMHRRLVIPPERDEDVGCGQLTVKAVKMIGEQELGSRFDGR